MMKRGQELSILMMHKYLHFAIKLAMCNYVPVKLMELSDPHFHEPNQKSFRLLYFAFTRNLQALHKTHKKIMTEFEEPIKVRLKKQEQTFVDTHIKKIYEENAHKLIKQNLQRNSNIQSIMNSYHLEYRQRKSQDSKTIEVDHQSIDFIEKSDQGLTLTEQKSRSKTVASHCNQQEPISRHIKSKQDKSRKNITDLDYFAGFSQKSEKKIMFFKRNYNHLKNRQRNYSFHSENIDNSNKILQNLSTCAFQEQKTSRDHTQNTPKQFPQKDCFNETFRPFYGLNTKDIFVKKPIKKVNNTPAENCTLTDFKINFVSRSIIRKIQTKKVYNHQFADDFYEKIKPSRLKGDQEQKKMMRQNILKTSSDIVIKTLQPQGYRGKSRLRYRSLNEFK